MATKFSSGNFLMRWISALILVCASYNPIAPYSFYSWAITPALTDYSTLTPLHGLVGIALLITWVIFIRATARSLGVFGVILAVGFFGMFIWFMVDKGWVTLTENQTLSWVIIIALSTLLAVGMSWSHVRRRMSGQLDVDETDDH